MVKSSDEAERPRPSRGPSLRDRDAEQDPHGRREQVVGEALVQEHLHEVLAARADGARDPELTPRSAASITKIRKISRMPAAIENEPNVVKNDMNIAPPASAA